MIGSHNTFSYLSPVNFWGKITKLWSKCQDKTFAEQYNSGIRYFDIRVKRINSNWHFVHNNVDYGLINFDFLDYLKDKNCYLRIIYDLRHFPSDLNEDEEKSKFIDLIEYIRDNSHIIGFIAITYWNWDTYVVGKLLNIAEFHASVSAPWYQYILGTKWWANKNNNKIKTKYKEFINDSDNVMLLDFI